VSRCSTFPPQRGPSMTSDSVLRASSMAFPSVGKGRALVDQASKIEPPDLRRRPCLITPQRS
jgi:hypothetical protein